MFAVLSFWLTHRLVVKITQFASFHFSQVRNVILKNRLAPAGTRPIVCIDEAQVLNICCWDWVLTKQ